MSKTIEQLAKEHLKSTKSNGLAITYSLDELEDFAKAYQAQNEQQESVAVLNSIWGSDTGWQYNIKLLPSFETDKYLESIDGHDIYLYLSTPKQATPEGWLAWQARAQSPISQNEQQEAVAYTDGEGDFITKEMYDEYLKLGFYTECIVPLYNSPYKQIPEDVIKDAERYRWLKNNEQVDVALCVWVDDDLTSEGGYYSAIFDYLIDEEIDKAMLNSAPTTSETNTEVWE